MICKNHLNSLDQEPLVANNEFYKSPKKRQVNAICSNDVLILLVHLFSKSTCSSNLTLAPSMNLLQRKCGMPLKKVQVQDGTSQTKERPPANQVKLGRSSVADLRWGPRPLTKEHKSQKEEKPKGQANQNQLLHPPHPFHLAKGLDSPIATLFDNHLSMRTSLISTKD